ncbi:hypothetical protein Tco_0931628, partial [Tanacetum coccineum]
MANLPPNHNEFAPAAEAALDNMNGWVEEEDPEMEEEEEDPEMEKEEEEMEMDADEEWDGPEWILPYQGRTHFTLRHLHLTPSLRLSLRRLRLRPRLRLTPLKRLFTETQVWIGSSSFSTAASHDPEDLTPSHIRKNKRLRMMLDCNENRTRDAWRELDRATWHYHHLRRWSIAVENLLPPRLQYQEPSYALPKALLALVTHNDPRDPYVAARDAATAPATDND